MICQITALQINTKLLPIQIIILLSFKLLEFIFQEVFIAKIDVCPSTEYYFDITLVVSFIKQFSLYKKCFSSLSTVIRSLTLKRWVHFFIPLGVKMHEKQNDKTYIIHCKWELYHFALEIFIDIYLKCQKNSNIILN